MRALAFSVAFAFLLSACGYRGPLVLPKPKPEAQKPAPAPKKEAPDP